jgi:hypothetical protein
MTQDQLTNEALKKRFKSNFELAAHAIRVARYFIRSGHEVNVDTLLKDMQKHPEQYEDDMIEQIEKAENVPQDHGQTPAE